MLGLTVLWVFVGVYILDWVSAVIALTCQLLIGTFCNYFKLIGVFVCGDHDRVIGDSSQMLPILYNKSELICWSNVLIDAFIGFAEQKN